MPAEIIQKNLFNVIEYGGKKTRGHYKKKEKSEKQKDDFEKIKDLNPYAEAAKIYASLANYFPVSIMGAQIPAECTEYKFIKLHYLTYEAEPYLYQGEICRGESFKIIEAELKGTERLKIDKRLYIHKKLLEAAKNGINIHEAAEQLQEEIKRLNNGENYTVDGD